MVKIVRQNYQYNHSIFNKTKTEIKKIIGVECVINHVGSTAIPNISGKNIIDILIGVVNTNELNIACNNLIKNGYYRGKDQSKKYQFLASREEETISGDIHLHIAVINTKRYNNFLLLKNYLLHNSSKAREYSNYKKELSCLDRKDYRKIKSAFVTKMIQESREYFIDNYPSQITFIRHANNILDSMLPNNLLPLSKKGEKEALKAKEKLNNNFDIIISSPSLRASQTAEIIGNGIKYICDIRLLEKGYGNKKQDGKETYIDSYKRLISFLGDLTKYSNKKILIVTHGSLLNLAKNVMEEKNIKRNHIKNCYMISYQIRKD